MSAEKSLLVREVRCGDCDFQYVTDGSNCMKCSSSNLQVVPSAAELKRQQAEAKAQSKADKLKQKEAAKAEKEQAKLETQRKELTGLIKNAFGDEVFVPEMLAPDAEIVKLAVKILKLQDKISDAYWQIEIYKDRGRKLSSSNVD